MSAETSLPADNPVVRLVRVSEPLSEPMTRCLQTLADMTFAEANQLLGSGNWSQASLSLEFFRDDGSVGTMLMLDRADGETDFPDLTSAGAAAVALQVGQLVAQQQRPWCAAQLDFHPDGSVVILAHYPIQDAASEAADIEAAPRLSAWGQSREYAALLDATTQARLAYFRTLGAPDADVWFPPIDPVFRGGPAWPTRPAWQRIRAGKQTVVASSGLANPFPDADGPNIGFGVEIAVATTDAENDYSPSQLLETVQAVCFQAADDGRFHLRHERFGVFLIGVRWISAAFPDWLDDNGDLGFLVGLPVPGVATTIALPAGTATLLIAKLLRPAEYAFVAAAGEDGARQLIQHFQRDGTQHLSSLRRASVV